MVALPDLGMAEGAYREISPAFSVIEDETSKPDLIQSDQLTISTVCSFVDGRFAKDKEIDIENGE